MDWILLSEDGATVENIIVADADFAASVGAVPYYDGAKIGGVYQPPAPPPTEQERLRADIDYIMLMGGL